MAATARAAGETAPTPPASAMPRAEAPPAAAGAREEEEKVPPAIGRREPGERPAFEDDWIFQDRKSHVRHQTVRLDGGVWADRLAAGVWYGLPLAHDGILPRLNDAIVLQLGGDYTWLHSGPFSTHGLWLAVGPRWDFHLTRAWSVHLDFQLGLFVTLATTPRDGPNFFQPGAGLGGAYRLIDPIRLTLDFGYPQGIRLGLDFDLDP